MVRVNVEPAHRAAHPHAGGFSLIEVMVAMLVLTVGMMSLVGVTAVAVQRAGQSSPMLIAREKARETIESVHSARDTGALAGLGWAKVRNAADGGVFLGGAKSLKVAGLDGLFNTGDDGAIETVRNAGADHILGNTDDVIATLNDYTREILIETLNYDGTNTVNPNLRKITVNVRYKVAGFWNVYTITTLVSSYS